MKLIENKSGNIYINEIKIVAITDNVRNIYFLVSLSGLKIEYILKSIKSAVNMKSVSKIIFLFIFGKRKVLIFQFFPKI